MNADAGTGSVVAVEKGLVGSPLPKGTQDAQDTQGRTLPSVWSLCIDCCNETFFFSSEIRLSKVLTKNLSHT